MKKLLLIEESGSHCQTGLAFYGAEGYLVEESHCHDVSLE